MGKKYIIELESGTHIFVLGPEGIVHIGEPDVVYGTFDGMQIGDAVINAKPYTEPDLEQVRTEAYEEGYKTAKIQCGIQAEKDMREVGERHYQRGLSDAWEAARKICSMNSVTRDEIFGMVITSNIIDENTAAEVIEKLKAHEQKHEEIKVGDEVTLKCGVSPTIYMKSTKGSDEIYLLFKDGSCGPHSKSEIERKTGRHFPEIAAVLDKMRSST
jgi:hypothetical protein